jgi:hypothetical protein
MKTLLELEDGDCRYPFGESAPYLFCGDPAQDKSSYCAGHHEICFKPDHGNLGRTAHPAYVSAMRKNSYPAFLTLAMDETGA